MPLLPTGSNLSIVTERVWEREITVRIDGTIIVLVYSDRENHILSPILVCRVRNVDVRASPRTSRFSYNLLQISQVYRCLMVIDWCVIDGSLINISSREIREEIFGKSVCQYYKILTPESPPHCQLALQWWWETCCSEPTDKIKPAVTLSISYTFPHLHPEAPIP